jgi:hypothetical protein
VQKGEVSIRKLIDQGLDYMSMEEISA